MMTMKMKSTPRRIAALALGSIALAVLAGCAQEYRPPYIAKSSYDVGPSTRFYDLEFVRGSVDLSIGELQRMRAILQDLEVKSGDDIIVRLGVTGNEEINQGRVASAAAAVGGTQARVRVLSSDPSPLGANNLALVEVVRYGRLRVICPSLAIDSWEEDTIGVNPPPACTNALNRAEMAANPRDLISPRELRGSEAIASIGAIERYRADRVKEPVPLVSTIGD